MSPSLFNMSIDFVSREMSEMDLASRYGYAVVEGLPAVSVLEFADGTTSISNPKKDAVILTRQAMSLFAEIGLQVNPTKSQAIIIKAGKLDCSPLCVDGSTTIPALQVNEKIRYLGSTSTDELAFDEQGMVGKLGEYLKKLVESN